MDCGTQCVKYLLFFFNFIFALSGIAILAIGVIIKLHLGKYIGDGTETFLYGKYMATPVLFIVVGVIVFVISFFGCCGAAKENQCMIVTFAVLLGIIFIIELAVGIAALVLKDDVIKEVQQHINTTMTKYNTSQDVHGLWDTMQLNLKCCGIHNSEDWRACKECFFGKVPSSCDCNTRDKTCDGAYWIEGCKEAMDTFITHNLKIIGGVGIGIAFIEILGIVFACCLACGIKNY